MLTDRNTRYFYNQVKSRWNKNKILSIENDHGELKQGHDDVQEVAVNYFSNLLGKPYSSSYEGLQTMGLNFDKVISSQQASMLKTDITDNEILCTLKSMKRNKKGHY